MLSYILIRKLSSEIVFSNGTCCIDKNFQVTFLTRQVLYIELHHPVWMKRNSRSVEINWFVFGVLQIKTMHKQFEINICTYIKIAVIPEHLVELIDFIRQHPCQL